MNWKLVTVILISLILLIICYLTIVSPFSEFKNYFKPLNNQYDHLSDHLSDSKIIKKRKIKIAFSKEEEFINWCANDNEHIMYYFPNNCPNYKLGYFLVDTDDEGHENYYVPENGHVVIVNKEHKWTKEPMFSYWKSEKINV